MKLNDLYNNEELEHIEKVRLANDKFEEFFLQKREGWSKNCEPLFDKMRKTADSFSSKDIIEIQALALSYRQILNEEITYFLTKRSKESSKLKKLKQEKFVFYSVGFSIKTNNGEKGVLIQGHLSEQERTIELIDSHIEFLRTTMKNLDSIGYSIKNIVDMLNYLK